MRIISSLEKKKYLRDLRAQMESIFAFGEPRSTGLVLGNFFYITRHAGYEWARKYSNEKHRAIGFVTGRSDSCAVNVICIPGHLDPVSLVLYYLLCMVVFVIHDAQTVGSPNYLTASIWAVVCSLAAGFISAAVSCFTDRGRTAYADLVTLLRNPVPIWEESYE